MPSTSRTVYLLAPQPCPTAPGISPTETQLTWPAKSVGDTLDYTLDATQFLLDASNDTIVSAAVTAIPAPADLVIESFTATSTAMTWYIQGGTAGVTYSFAVMFTTAQGLQVSRTIKLPVTL